MANTAKYHTIASELTGRIRRGEMSHRDKLPSELELAREFSVSRGTVRQALAALQKDGFIETALGAGSFVTYDGRRLEDNFGWSKSLARGGAHTVVRLVAMGKLDIPSLANELALDSTEFLVVERVRVTTEGEAISLERSRLPWRASFATVLATGLVENSIQSTLIAHGVTSVSSREVIGVAILGSTEARLLDRPVGQAFLENEQTSFDSLGNVVERVVSLLHPDHFKLEHHTGQPPAPRIQRFIDQ